MLVHVITSVRFGAEKHHPPHSRLFGDREEAYEGVIQAVRDAVGYAHHRDYLNARETDQWWADADAARSEPAREDLRRRWNEFAQTLPEADLVYAVTQQLRYNPFQRAVEGLRGEMLSEAANNPDLLGNEEALRQRIDESSDTMASVGSDQDLAMMFMNEDVSEFVTEATEMVGLHADLDQVLRIAFLLRLQSEVTPETIVEAAEEHQDASIDVAAWPENLRGVPAVLSILNEYVTIDSELLDPIADPDAEVEVEWYPHLRRYRIPVTGYIPEDPEVLPIAFEGLGQVRRGASWIPGGFWRPGIEEIGDLATVIRRRLGAWTRQPYLWEVGVYDDAEGIFIAYDNRGLPGHAAFLIDLELEPLEIEEARDFIEGEGGIPAYEPPPPPRVPAPPPSFVPPPRFRDVGRFR